MTEVSWFQQNTNKWFLEWSFTWLMMIITTLEGNKKLWVRHQLNSWACPIHKKDYNFKNTISKIRWRFEQRTSVLLCSIEKEKHKFLLSCISFLSFLSKHVASRLNQNSFSVCQYPHLSRTGFPWLLDLQDTCQCLVFLHLS